MVLKLGVGLQLFRFAVHPSPVNWKNDAMSARNETKEWNQDAVYGDAIVTRPPRSRGVLALFLGRDHAFQCQVVVGRLAAILSVASFEVTAALTRSING
jgi:hypothetical protein